MNEVSPQRRRTDTWFGWLTRIWDWIDARDIDKHIVVVVTMCWTWRLTEWSMHYAATSPRPGLEVAAILAAVGAPFLAMQGAALKWYFEARST